MARIRQIKPDFFLDDELAATCIRDARLCFIGLWNLADREGRLEDRPAKIKAQVFPYDDDITIANIVEFLDQLSSGSFIIRYQVGGKPFIWIRTFKQHQHFHRDEQESKLPEPPKDMEIHRASTVQAPRLHPTCTPTSTSTYGIRHTASGNGDAPKKRRRSSQQTGCPDIFEPSESMKEWAQQFAPELNLEDETENFLLYWRSKGGSFVDWDAAWRTWIKKAKKFKSERNNGNQGGLPYKPDTIGQSQTIECDREAVEAALKLREAK